MTGSWRGSRGVELGVGTFVDDEGGYTSISVALSLLVCVALTLSLASVAWTQNRSADVQAVSDATALAGSNVVSSYVTVATVLDACVLTMGAGLVASAVPGLSAVGASTIDAGTKILDARQTFATSAAEGLQAVEATLPMAIVARSAAQAQANNTESVSYHGCAIPFPSVSETDFSALDSDVSADGLVEVSDELQGESDRVKEAEDKVDAAKLEGWLADCGGEPRSMRERASVLAGLEAGLNPHYATPDDWTFGVALLRARAYYARRVSTEAPSGQGIDAVTDSLCRATFYQYALGEVRAGHYEEHADGSVSISLPELPKNTSEMRGTRLYTDVRWPCSQEDAGRTLHSSLSCPGATGASAGMASLAELDAGGALECTVCSMGAADLGKVAAASTSIDNGFEHHWRRVVEASRLYQQAVDELVEARRALRETSEQASDLFDRALEQLAVPRPRLKPAGALGCVAVVGRGSGVSSPGDLAGSLIDSSELPAGAAASAATLAPDVNVEGNDMLTRLFEAVADDIGSGSAGVLGTVGELWGKLLVGYGAAVDGLSSAADDLVSSVEGVPGGSVAAWLRDRIAETVRAVGLEPADLRLRKPVLTNTQNVLDAAGYGEVSSARELVARLPDTDDPAALARALGRQVVNELGGGVFTIAELEVPGTGVRIPLTLDAGALLGSMGS